MVAAASWSTISQMWVAHHVVAVVPLLPLRAEDVATCGHDMDVEAASSVSTNGFSSRRMSSPEEVASSGRRGERDDRVGDAGECRHRFRPTDLEGWSGNNQTVLSRLAAVLEAPDPDFAIVPP